MTDDEKVDAIFDVLGGDFGDSDERSLLELVVQHADEVAAVLQNRNPRLAGYPACDDSQQSEFTHEGQ